MEVKITKGRFYTLKDKVVILRRHLLEQVAISDLCDQHGMDPSMFYRRQKELFEGGHLVFQKDTDKTNAKLEKKISQLQQKSATKNEVLSELMEEHVALKKTVARSERLLGAS